jgi:hypothetical protein
MSPSTRTRRFGRLALLALALGGCKDGSAGGAAGSASTATAPLVELKVESVSMPAKLEVPGEDGGHDEIAASEQRLLVVVETEVRYSRCQDDEPDLRPPLSSAAPPAKREAKIAFVHHRHGVLHFADGSKAVAIGGKDDGDFCMDCERTKVVPCDGGGKPAAVKYSFLFSVPRTAELKTATFEVRDVRVPLSTLKLPAPPPAESAAPPP